MKRSAAGLVVVLVALGTVNRATAQYSFYDSLLLIHSFVDYTETLGRRRRKWQIWGDLQEKRAAALTARRLRYSYPAPAARAWGIELA